MSRISYFQRYSQKENHATNNTLLVLRRFYEASPDRLQGILVSLLGVDLSVGLSFQQQVHGEFSVPDALISQEALHVYFETKRGSSLDANQVRSHLESIANTKSGGAGTWVLVGLTKEPIAHSDLAELRTVAKDYGILFSVATFSQLVEELERQCAVFERELLVIVEDFRSYLAEEGLLEEGGRVLPVFACGESLKENVEFSVYYEPASRPSKSSYRFIGIYANKAVRYIGRVQSVTIASFSADKIDVESELGSDAEAEREWIRTVVDSTPYYNLRSEPKRYYRVDKFVGTNLKKQTGIVRAVQYLDLTTIVDGYDVRKAYTTDELAHLLDGKTFG
jgi:hypothetical protein